MSILEEEERQERKLILKKMADDDHQQHADSSTHLVRIVREIDFFDEHKRCKRTYFLPLLKNQSLQAILIPDIIKPALAMSSSPKKRVFRVQESTDDGDDDDLQQSSDEILFPDIITPRAIVRVQETDDDDNHGEETSLSFLDASIDQRYDQKKRKATNFDLFEGVSVYSNSRIIRLFGVNLMMTSDLTTIGIVDYDIQETSPSFSDASTYQKRRKTSDGSFEGVPVYNNPRIIRLFGVNLLMSSDDIPEEKRAKAKGKEKIVDTGNQELEVDDDHHGFNSQTFLIARKLSVSRATRIIINDKKKKIKKTGNPSNRRKWKNPNVHHQEQQFDAPVIPPLFHPRILEEIQQHEPPVFVFEKNLQFSDVASGLNRLLITRSEKLMGFLTEEERRKMEDKDDDLRVLTRDTQGNEYTLHLTKWHAAGMIVLKHDWCKLVTANTLQKGDSVQGWGYRRGDEFRLALNFIRKEQY